MALASEQISVLIVEDDPAIRELVTYLLEEDGYRVYVAADGAEALRQLDEIEQVDLVVSDVNMPVMDGIELSHRLYATLPSLPVLLMSGRQHPNMNRSFIPKPFRRESLRDAMQLLIGPKALAAAAIA